MQLYIKSLIAALLPLFLATIASTYYINELSLKQEKAILNAFEVEKNSIKEGVKDYIDLIENSANILSNATDVANGILQNDNDLLFEWGRLFLGKHTDKITFISLQGDVIARAHDEFHFNDKVDKRAYFQETLKNGTFLGVTKNGDEAFITKAKVVKKYGQIDSGIVAVSKKIDEDFIKNINNSGTVNTLFTDDKNRISNIKKEAIFFDVLHFGFFENQNGEFIVYGTKNGELESFVALKYNMFFGMIGISAILSIVLLVVLFRHLSPYQELVKTLSKYGEGKIGFEGLEVKSRTLAQKYKKHEIGEVAKAVENFSKKAGENQRKIEDINKDLDSKIKEEVLKNEQNEKLLIFRDRQAQMGVMMESILHQWKQPITIIALKIDLLRILIFEDDVLEKDIIENELDSMESQIGFIVQTNMNLSNFFRKRDQNSLFMPESSLKTVIGLFGEIFRKQDIELNISGTSSHHVVGNSNEFMQVVLNIIDNAKDEIISRGIKLGKIECRISEDDDALYLEIEDNAGGVREDRIDKIFDYQFSTKGDKGSGIGLFLSKKIIEESLHGKIWCKNHNEGALFLIELPSFKEN